MSLRPLAAKDVIKILVKIGFVVKRQRGSHVFLKHPDGRAIIKEAKLTKREFLKLLEEV